MQHLRQTAFGLSGFRPVQNLPQKNGKRGENPRYAKIQLVRSVGK